MSTELLLGAWIGDMRGSLVANLFVNVTNSSGKCEFDLRVNAGGNVTVYRGGIIQEETGQHPIAELTAVPIGTNVATGLKLFMQFEIVEQYRLQGRWSLSDGNAGIFYFASTQNTTTQADEASTIAPAPIQIVQQTKTLPKMTLYRDEVIELIAKMKSLLPTSYEVVVRVNAAENKELRRLSSAFWEAPSLPRKTEWLNLYLTEPTSGTARSITINLSPSDCSYSVSGPEDIWVTGAFHELLALLSSKHSWWRYAFERYALNLNGIALLLALTLSPDLNLGPRIALLFVTICLILIVKWLYDQTASVRVFLKSDFSEAKYIDFPRLLTTLAGALIIALVTGTYRILGDGTVQAWLEWLTSKKN